MASPLVRQPQAVLDLVRLQIEIAEGRRLDVVPVSSGHAIEARLYAEDPANEFMPSPGTITVWHPPTGVRVDSAIEVGQEIGIDYDPLLAKIIVHGPDRDTACRRLVRALEETRVVGVQTNREYLIQQLVPRRFRGLPAGFRNNQFATRPLSELRRSVAHVARQTRNDLDD